MRKHLVLPAILMAFLLISAKSCDEDHSENLEEKPETVKEEMEEVKDGFQADFLNEESLAAMTQKARQTLKDFSEYMNIANDISNDSLFRSQALGMAGTLFYENGTPVKQYAGLLVTIDSIWLTLPLHLTEKGLYKGLLGFRERTIIISEKDSNFYSIDKKQVEIFGIKSIKEIGGDSLWVWQLYLGNISRSR